MSGYMHPGWDGRWPGEGVVSSAPPDPHHHEGSYRPLPAKAAPAPAPCEAPPRRPPRQVPAWEAAQLAGSDCVGPGAAWDDDAWRER